MDFLILFMIVVVAGLIVWMVVDSLWHYSGWWHVAMAVLTSLGVASIPVLWIFLTRRIQKLDAFVFLLIFTLGQLGTELMLHALEYFFQI